jgi:hypothetical protein
MTATGVKSWQSCAKIRSAHYHGFLLKSAAILGVRKRRQDETDNRSSFATAARKDLRHHWVAEAISLRRFPRRRVSLHIGLAVKRAQESIQRHDILKSFSIRPVR